jgi:hypothetical protein
MRRLNFSLYKKLVRPVARMAIGWVGALLLIIGGVILLFMAMGIRLNYVGGPL